MATHTGSEGVVKVASNTVAEITGYSIDESADTIETTELSDSTKSFSVGTTSWSGSLDAHWDETDTNGQGAMTIGASITLNLYPEGATTGDQYATGTALITSLTVNSSINGVVSTTIGFTGTGALTWGAVS